MARYVLHSGGVVTSVCEASAEWVAANAPTADLVSSSVNVAEGWLRTGPGAYTEPTTYSGNAAAIEAHRLAINAERDRRIATGTVFVSSVGQWFRRDNFTMIQLLTLSALGASLPARDWRSVDGIKITATQAFVAAFIDASADRDVAIFEAAEDARDAMMADPQNWSISSVTWPTEYTGDIDD